MKYLLLLFLFILGWAEKDLSHGFRSEIDWVPFDKAVGIAKDLNQPIFFLIHKTWCGACKGLRNEFKTSPKAGDLIELSKKFVMVNVEDDEEPEDEKYSPDGGYIPRLLFLDTDGNPLSVNNEKRYRNNKYFYPLVPQVIDGMERALKEFNGESTEEEETSKPVEKKEEKKEKKEEKKDKKEEKKEKKEEKKEDKKEKKEDKKEKKEVKDEKKQKKEEKKKDEDKEEKKEKKKEKEVKKDDKKKDKEEKKEKKDEKKEDKKKKDDKKDDKKTKDEKKNEKEKKDDKKDSKSKDSKKDKSEKKSDKKSKKEKKDEL